MKRPLSIVFVAVTACAAPARAELLREVFPVPPVVDAAFRNGGLAAFDPFDAWQDGTGKPSLLLRPAASGEEAARLPLGDSFDVLPAWTARGFKPCAGTRVLYHPETQLLFAKFALEDEAQIRAFCDWPPAVWMSEAYWRGYGLHQPLYRVTSWEGSATGPGGWHFQPSTVEELLALPVAARRILARQSMVIRGGQRSRVEGYATSLRNRDVPLTGMIAEAECTVGEDGSTIDFNNAPELTVRLDDGTRAVLSSTFPQLIEWDNSWLMEAGTLPGNPPRRIFHAFETLRVDGEMNSAALTRCYERWTGGGAGAAMSGEGVVGRALSIMDFPPLLLPPPDIPGVVPFAAREPADEKKPDPRVHLVPELFGDVPVQDVSAELATFAGAKTRELQAWRRSDYSRLYVRGTPGAMAALTRWIEKELGSKNLRMAIAEVTVRLLPNVGAPEGKIIWRGTIPVRGAKPSAFSQPSAFKFSVGDSAEDFEVAPLACELEVEAWQEDAPVIDPFEEKTQVWSLIAKASLRPPLMESPVSVDRALETGTRDGVMLSRVIGRTAAGRNILLTIRLKEREVHSRWWFESPLHDWWWRKQLAKAAQGGTSRTR